MTGGRASGAGSKGVAKKMHKPTTFIEALGLVYLVAIVGLISAEVRPVGGVRAHYGFEPRGHIFMENKFAHLVVDVNLSQFEEVVRVTEKIVDVLMLKKAAAPLSDPFGSLGVIMDRVRWMNVSYEQIVNYYTEVEDEQNLEVRTKRFVIAALLAGAIGGLTGSGLYGYMTGGQSAQVRENIDKLDFRVSKLVHVAETQAHSITALDDDLSRMKKMTNRLASAVQQDEDGLQFVELATKVLAVVDATAGRLDAMRLVASMASANRVSHELLPFEEAKREFAALKKMVEAQGRKLVTEDVRKIVTMEATMLPGKGQFSVVIHVPTYHVDRVLEVYKYESYAFYDEARKVNLRVKSENTHLAVAIDGRFFTELSADQLASCHIMGRWRWCPDVRQVRDDANGSCLMSLFLGEQADAMRLCPLHVEPVGVNVDVIGGNTFRLATSTKEANQRVHFACRGNMSMVSVQLVAETQVELKPGCVGRAGPVKFYSEDPEIVASTGRNLLWEWTVPLAEETVVASAMVAREELQLTEEWSNRVLPTEAGVLVGMRQPAVHWTGWSALSVSLVTVFAMFGIMGCGVYLHCRKP